MSEFIAKAIQENAHRFPLGESFRVFHGRGKCFAGHKGIALDYHSSCLLLLIYELEDEMQLDFLVQEIKSCMPLEGISSLLIQRRDLKRYKLECIFGDIPKNFVAKREGAVYLLSSENQNSGFFMDIEPARIWLEQSAKNKKILNLFSFTCSFSVVALQAGAKRVVNVDMSSSALNVGRQNHRLNEIDTDDVEFIPHNVLRSWGKLKKRGPYDLVIVDPPSFQRGSFEAEKDYKKVIRKLPELLCGDGLALLCLNDPATSLEEFSTRIESADASLDFVESLAANEDFPDCAGGQLKMLVYRCHSELLPTPL